MKNPIKSFDAPPLNFDEIADATKNLQAEKSEREKVVVILGATSAGKSSLGLKLAEKFDTEIISADSGAVYKNFNIGTAKPSPEELKRVRHYLIDILEPEEKFSVVEFVKLAGNLITEINSRKKIPIIVGGTGLYIQALLEGYEFSEVGGDGKISKSTESYFAKTGNLKYNALVFGLMPEREELYRRINLRTEKMFADGLVDEVKSLLDSGVSENSQAMLAIGYKETVEYLKGAATLGETISKVAQATRNFAKRQMTWYRRMKYIKFFDSGR